MRDIPMQTAAALLVSEAAPETKQRKAMPLNEKKVKRLIDMMNEMTTVKIPPMKPIIRCFEAGMDEDILEYLLRVGTAGHSKKTLEELYATMRATGEISAKRSWNELWDELMVMSFLVPQENADTYELASIFPGWIELSTSGPRTEQRIAIMEHFMDFWQLLRKINKPLLRQLADAKGIKKRDAGLAAMATLTAVTPAHRGSAQRASDAGRTIAVDEPLTSEQRVLTKGTAFEILARHKDSIAAMNCICRNHKEIATGKTCDQGIPLQSCMPVGAIARQLVESGVARPVPYEEAVAMMEDFERKGCIHTTFHYAGKADHEAMAICNCCTDCCLLYGGWQKGYMSKVQVKSYSKPVIVDESACTGCNLCGRFCPTKAIRFDTQSGRLSFTYENCIGCGQCVTQCPAAVQRMVADDRTVFVKTRKPSEADA